MKKIILASLLLIFSSAAFAQDRDWKLRADMNRDGSFTISDVWELLYSLFFYPGDWIVDKIIGTGFGNFFEFSSNNYGGFSAGLISLICWLALFGGIKGMFEGAVEKETAEDKQTKEDDIEQIGE